MKGQPIVAIHRETGKIKHISQISETGLKCGCSCHDCDEPLQAVLNTPYQQHFRHGHNKNCNPTPESRLHLLAKAIIEQNDRILIPDRGMVSYVNPKVEARCGELIPDATITVDGQTVYIEVVVTHPLQAPKIETYREKNATVLVIRLTEEDREMDYDTLKYFVLEDPENRSVLPMDAGNEILLSKNTAGWIWLIVVGLGGIVVLKNWINPGRKQRR